MATGTGSGESSKAKSLAEKEALNEPENGEITEESGDKSEILQVAESSVDKSDGINVNNSVENKDGEANDINVTEREENEKLDENTFESNTEEKAPKEANITAQIFKKEVKAEEELTTDIINEEFEQERIDNNLESEPNKSEDSNDGTGDNDINSEISTEKFTYRESGDGTDAIITKSLSIKQKKTPINIFLAKEDSVQFGSVDHVEDAHVELEKLRHDTSGKSLEDELKEITANVVERKQNVNVEADPESVSNLETDEFSKNQLPVVIDKDPHTDTEDNDQQTVHQDIADGPNFNNAINKVNEVRQDSSDTTEENAEQKLKVPYLENHENKELVDICNKTENNTNTDISITDYDADLSDNEEIERTKEVKAALYSCLKGKWETFDTPKSIQVKRENYKNTRPVVLEEKETISNETSVDDCNGDINVKDIPEIQVEEIMPETRENVDGTVSPSLMFATVRYRWEKTIFTQAPSVVFVTLNKKELEPVKLEWSQHNRCFYSDETKLPVGVYVGNLVIDGTFYPVEDITVKYYTFEVDLYLKEDILEEENNVSGLEKAEEFVRQKHSAQNQAPVSQDYTCPHTRASSFPYTSKGTRMEEGQNGDNQGEGGIHISNKYEELVRSQMHQNKSGLNDTEAETTELEGRGTPVGEDSIQSYQDGGGKSENILQSAVLKSEAVYDPAIDSFFEPRSTHSKGSVQNGYDSLDRKSPAVIDDVLGNGHTRSPIYSTESPVYSKHSSAHSSARQTPTTFERPESVGSGGSARSPTYASRQVLDDLINNALEKNWQERTSPVPGSKDGSRTALTPTRPESASSRPESAHSGQGSIRSRPESVGSVHSETSSTRRGINDIIEDSLNATKTPPPSWESSVSGSRPLTPTPPAPEQIADVLNPSDRHSPIRQEFLAGSPALPEQSPKLSRQSSAQNSAHGSAQNSAPGSQRQTPQKEFLSSSYRASQEKLYNGEGIRHLSGSANSSDRPGTSSSASSRPQSLTSEQELSQYYENLADNKHVTNLVNSGLPAPRTGSASSLPAIGSQPRFSPDKRSMTPDYLVRVPAGGPVSKTSLIPTRTPPRTPVSGASSRTITPVIGETETEARLREQVKDLENTVSNLRKILTSREQEIVELKDQFAEVRDINRKLQGDLDLHRTRSSPAPQIAELQRQLDEVCQERDSLISEVDQLKDELRQRQEPSLNHYDPNSPSALQRKIDELNSHIQDLQEAQDAASIEIQSAEKKVKELAAENETLRVAQADRVRDLEDANRQLKSEIRELKEGHVGHSDVTDYRFKIELQQVKEDNRNLRERNYQLHEDNIRLKEELSDLRKSLDYMGSAKRSFKEEVKRPRKFDAYERSDVDKSMHTEASLHSDLNYPRHMDPVSERLTDKDGYIGSRSRSSYESRSHDTLRTDSRDHHEETFAKTEAARYESYRMGPDGGSAEKVRTPLYTQPFISERISTVGSTKRDNSRSQDRLDYSSRTLDKFDLGPKVDLGPKTLDRVELRSRTLERGDDFGRPRKERARTSSAEIDFKSAPLSAYHGDLSKTMPALSGRSKDSRSRAPEKVLENLTKRDACLSQHRQIVDKELRSLEKQCLLSHVDDGNMSDTPTDILVNIQPVDKIPTSTWGQGHQRRGSVGSDASNSSFSDIDEQISASVRKRSKSADGREILRRMGPTGKENMTLSRTLSPAPSAGLRSITPRPIPTQHNKTGLSLSSSLNSLTQGLRPFAPRSAQDLQINDVIKFSRQGGKLSQGTIKFIGHLPGRGDIYLGVELDKEDGKHDGVFEGIRYFKCKPNKGVFVAYNKVVMAWTSY